MAETMTLNNILSELQNLGDSGMEKTAEEAASTKEKIAGAKEELVNALNSAMGPQEPEKTASVEKAPVVDKVMKIAEDLAASEKEALTKEANFYGAAVGDGFLARVQPFLDTLNSTKTASAGNTEEDFEKFAEENPELVKQAVELGYHHGKMRIDQTKQAAFVQGYQDAAAQIQELSKTAEGQEKLAEVVQIVQKEAEEEQVKVASEFKEWTKTAEGQKALPHMRQGYKEASEALSKMASDVFDQAYNNTLSILQAL